MGKYIPMILLILLLCGCNKKAEEVKTNLAFDEDSYKVYEPYKRGVSNDYVVNHITNHYDFEEVESSLMDISMSYYSPSNTYYQAGQYLSQNTLSDLLSKDKWNKSDSVVIDGVTIDPTYLSYIYEQNYLSSEGKLKGMSLALVLSPYQAYQNQYGSYLYKKVDEKLLLEFGQKKAQLLVEYLRKNEKLKDTKILIGLYFQNGPNDVLPGSFKQVGITTGDKITFQTVDYQYLYLESDTVQQNDINSYTSFQSLKKKLSETFPMTYVVATGLYVNGKLQNLSMDVHSTYMNKGELLKLSELISTELSSNFQGNVSTKVNLKENNDTVGFISKEKTSSTCKVYIMKG